MVFGVNHSVGNFVNKVTKGTKPFLLWPRSLSCQPLRFSFKMSSPQFTVLLPATPLSLYGTFPMLTGATKNSSFLSFSKLSQLL